MKQEGTLQRAPDEKHPAPFPPAHSLAEKKNKIPTKGIVIRSPVPLFHLPPRVSHASLDTSPAPTGLVFLSLRLHSWLIRLKNVDQPRPFHYEPEDLPLMVINKPAVAEPGPSCLDLTPSVLIVIEDSDAERSGSSCRKPEALAIVVLDEPTAKRPTPPCDLQVGFGERLQKCLNETIEVSCSSVQGDQS